MVPFWAVVTEGAAAERRVMSLLSIGAETSIGWWPHPVRVIPISIGVAIPCAAREMSVRPKRAT